MVASNEASNRCSADNRTSRTCRVHGATSMKRLGRSRRPTRDCHLPVLHRLPQNLQGVGPKLGSSSRKRTPLCKAKSPRLGVCRRPPVPRRKPYGGAAEGPYGIRGFHGRRPHHRVFRCLQSLLKAHIWKYPGRASKHALARPEARSSLHYDLPPQRFQGRVLRQLYLRPKNGHALRTNQGLRRRSALFRASRQDATVTYVHGHRICQNALGKARLCSVFLGHEEPFMPSFWRKAP